MFLLDAQDALAHERLDDPLGVLPRVVVEVGDSHERPRDVGEQTLDALHVLVGVHPAALGVDDDVLGTLQPLGLEHLVDPRARRGILGVIDVTDADTHGVLVMVHVAPELVVEPVGTVRAGPLEDEVDVLGPEQLTARLDREGQLAVTPVSCLAPWTGHKRLLTVDVADDDRLVHVAEEPIFRDETLHGAVSCWQVAASLENSSG